MLLYKLDHISSTSSRHLILLVMIHLLCLFSCFITFTPSSYPVLFTIFSYTFFHSLSSTFSFSLSISFFHLPSPLPLLSLSLSIVPSPLPHHPTLLPLHFIFLHHFLLLCIFLSCSFFFFGGVRLSPFGFLHILLFLLHLLLIIHLFTSYILII
jgi:hypothetical protein